MKQLYNYKLIDSIIIFLAGLGLFLFGLNQQEIVGFESRFYVFALEMWRHGLSWFPTTYQKPYPDYPVTSTLLIYGFAKLFGTLNKTIAVLPSAIASALTLVVTYLIGCLHSRRWGGFAVIFLFFTGVFIVEARTISMDEFITLIATLCFYLVYSAELLPSKSRFYWIFPLFILGFAFRGPIGLIIPTGVVCVFYFLEKNYKMFFLVGFLSLLLMNACLSVFLVLSYHVGGFGFVQEVLGMQVFSRLKEEHTPSHHFYFVNSFFSYALTFLLMVLMLPRILVSFFKKNLTKEIKFLLYLLGWILVILIGLSLPADKKPRYVLSIAPALALFCAYLFVCDSSQRYLRFLKNCFFWIIYFFPAIFVGLLYFFKKKLSFAFVNYIDLIEIFVFLQLIIFGLYFLAREKEFRILALGVLVFFIGYICIVEPTNIKYNRARSFVAEVENLRGEQDCRIVFYHEEADGWVIKYFAQTPTEICPRFAKDYAGLLHYSHRALFIATQSRFHYLPVRIKQKFTVVLEGKIGHVKVVVFRKKSQRMIENDE